MEGEVDTKELALGERDTDRVPVMVWDTEEEEETVVEMVVVGEVEEDLEGEFVAEPKLVEETVRVALEEALGEREPDRVMVGDLD